MLGVVKSRPFAKARIAAAQKKKQIAVLSSNGSAGNSSSGPINVQDNDDADLLDVEMYEPYHVEQDLPSIPLWAYLEKEGLDYAEEYDWEKLVSLPWLPITKMRVSVHKALCEQNDVSYAPQKKKNVILDFEGTGIPTEVRMKPYVTKQYCGTIKFICALDQNEKGRGGEGLTFNQETKEELAFVMRAVEHEST